MSAEKAPTILTKAGADKLAARIRRNLAAADDDLLRAWEGRAWEAAGLDSFADWCTAITADLVFVRLTVPARRERVLRLVEAGASQRDVATAAGVSAATVNADATFLEDSGRLRRPEKVRGSDGILRPATTLQAPVQTSVDRRGLTLLLWEAWQRVEQAGETGLTAWELEKKTRWRHGRVSSLLHRLEKRGAVVRDREQVRDGYTAYVALPLDG